ncbi:hypothetical protein EDB80DRAFT_754879 [Ilyonectria destructans]|nr:hypothetical protein EDB80DRAFT_754879 [Ilyonectria destructans]
MLGFLRPVRSLVKTLVLISLPVTILPFLNGLIEGVFVGNYLLETGYASVLYLQQDLAAKDFAEHLTVSGHRVVDAVIPPFHVLRLHDPTDWWERLGLERLDFDKEAYPPYGSPDPTSFASLHGLHRRVTDPEEEPWHHWVYASAQPWHMEGLLMDGWDTAFEELIRYHYANPSVASASFKYISCPESFLCASWRVHGPALLHFTTEGKVEDQVPNYDAVTVRIIEFPLKENPMLPGVFPSYFNQLKAVTEDVGWASHLPQSEFKQFLRRYSEVCENSELAYPRSYGRLAKLERAVLWTMSFENSFSPKVARFIAICLSGASRILGYRALNKILDLLGAEQLRFLFASLEDDTKEEIMSAFEGTEALNALLDTFKRLSKEKDEQEGVEE